MEGFEQEARGGQARREPAAFQITDEISDRAEHHQQDPASPAHGA